MQTIVSGVMLVALLGAAPVLARAPEPATVTQVVALADLDLRQDAGTAELDRRIRRAVQQACGATSDVDLAGKLNARQCRIAARRSAALQRDRAIAYATRSPALLAAAER